MKGPNYQSYVLKLRYPGKKVTMRTIGGTFPEAGKSVFELIDMGIGVR